MAIDTIYDAIAALNISVNGTTATAYKPGTTPEKLYTADLPARIIMPMSAPQEGAQTTVRTFGGNRTIIWEVEDVLLFTPIGQGDSLGSKVEDLALYMDAYDTAIYASGNQLAAFAWVDNVSYDVDVRTYPAGDPTEYLSVIATLTITETR